MKKMYISCPLENQVADALTKANIRFVHETQNNGSRLDFYLPDFDLYIEVKSGFTERITEQIKSQKNVIVLQGVAAVKFITSLILKNTAN